jgi:C1A family cysteine protease
MFKQAIIALLCITMITADESILFKRFVEFTHKFNKVYSSMEEFTRKFEVFKTNLLEVLAADSFSGSHTKGITKFSDLTKAEFKAQYLTLKTKSPNSWCQSSSKFLAAATADAEVDWRTKGGVSPVKDQGQCGSCWAFSTIAFLESQSLIKNKKAVTFSEQQLVDCDHNGDQGCNGGLMQTALQYIQASGIESDTHYPYTAQDDSCAYSKSDVVATVSNINCYEDVSVQQLQTYLTTVGPLAIAVDANDFQSYDSGILECTETQLDHGVLLVGYTANSWIIKNSWGKNWGEAGFVRVSNVEGQNCAVGAYVATATLN